MIKKSKLCFLVFYYFYGVLLGWCNLNGDLRRLVFRNELCFFFVIYFCKGFKGGFGKLEVLKLISLIRKLKAFCFIFLDLWLCVD